MITQAVQGQSLSGNIKSDLGVYAETPRPVRPVAGGKVVDPVFGAEIMRVTDETDGAEGGTSYSYWPTFNKDNTRMMAQIGGGHIQLFRFNPATFQLGAKEAPALPPGRGYYSFEDAIWSGTDPDVFYLHQGASFYAYNVATRSYTLVADLSSRLPAGYYLMQMSLSRDNDTFACTLMNANYAIAGYLVYRRSTDMLKRVDTVDLDEVRIDKTGAYLVVTTQQQGAGKIQTRVMNVADWHVRRPARQCAGFCARPSGCRHRIRRRSRQLAQRPHLPPPCDSASTRRAAQFRERLEHQRAHFAVKR
jgi:hypothetical protein